MKLKQYCFGITIDKSLAVLFMTGKEKNQSHQHVQLFRLRRLQWGVGSHLCTNTIVFALYLLGMMPFIPAILYACSSIVLNATFYVMIRSGFNERFEDPSLTVWQLVCSLFPSVFVMYFITDAQARTVFLLLATGTMVFGMFSLRRQAIRNVGWTILATYLALLLSLQIGAPERINWQVEAVVIFAYASVIYLVSYLGGKLVNMRSRLKAQNKQLERMASLDPLTDLPNRRSLMQTFERVTHNTDRRNQDNESLSIGMLDIDNFKQINDSFGHDIGDAVLIKLSAKLRRTLRQEDFIGRFGGEEFLVILPETGLDAAEATGQRLCQAANEAFIEELPVNYPLSVSIGVTEYKQGEKLEETIQRADRALYEAKASGRNRVIAANHLLPKSGELM